LRKPCPNPVWHVAITCFTKESAAFFDIKPEKKSLIIPGPRTCTFDSMAAGFAWFSTCIPSSEQGVLWLMLHPFRCSVTSLASMSILLTQVGHGPTDI